VDLIVYNKRYLRRDALCTVGPTLDVPGTVESAKTRYFDVVQIWRLKVGRNEALHLNWTGLESDYLTTLYSIEDCQRHYGL